MSSNNDNNAKIMDLEVATVTSDNQSLDGMTGGSSNKNYKLKWIVVAMVALASFILGGVLTAVLLAKKKDDSTETSSFLQGEDATRDDSFDEESSSSSSSSSMDATTTQGPFWKILTNSQDECIITGDNDRCIQSHAQAAPDTSVFYSPYSLCRFQVLATNTNLDLEFMVTEAGQDNLILHSFGYSGNDVEGYLFDEYPVEQGDVITWMSDKAHGNAGWRICLV